MKAGGANSAWLLVTAYYCAFFSCIEICKLLDRISFSLDDNDIATLSYKAIGPHRAQFFSGTQKNFVGTQYAGMLRFRSVGAKPHKAAWENVRIVFSQIFSSKGWVDANRYIQILSDDEYSPSRIRNIWNYARSDYYGETGESIAENFTKLIGNPRGAFGWLVSRQQKLDSLDPSIIAVLCESLAAAVLNASERAGNLVSERASI
ncbi:hypothetical protein B7760_05819 (plasmid) [Burkholderia glumae]|nr:hypothetical protein B7760_05819 [Burkholderia glumae]